MIIDSAARLVDVNVDFNEVGETKLKRSGRSGRCAGTAIKTVVEARRRSGTKGWYNDALSRTGSMVRGSTELLTQLIAKGLRKRG